MAAPDSDSQLDGNVPAAGAGEGVDAAAVAVTASAATPATVPITARITAPITAPITAIRSRAYRIPTDQPEQDGTLSWRDTTLVVAEVDAGGKTGLGYTYANVGAAAVIRGVLARCIQGRDAWNIEALWGAMRAAVRNAGYAGIAATAISAVDCALWDLKARLMNMPLARLLGMARDKVPVYGSGGFTTYDEARLRDQLGRWVHEDGCRAVKLKVGARPEQDGARVAAAREAVGAADLFVDANGAFTPSEALAQAGMYAAHGVVWFEEPVSSDDLEGLRRVRGRLPLGMDLAAGEYGYALDGIARMLIAGAVDVLQADASRCGGVTGFLRVAALCDAMNMPLSAHCAPALHLHVAAAAPRLRHQEWFHDHVRIESMLFDGAPRIHAGAIAPDLSQPGCGLVLRRRDAARYAHPEDSQGDAP